MATVQRSAPVNGVAPSKPAQIGGLQLSLPTTRSKPAVTLGSYTVLIYGEKKIGKTSLAAQFPKTLFMMFEPGGKGLEIFQVACPSWEHFIAYIKQLKDTDHDFETIVIDTVDIAYNRCMESMGRRYGFKHPNDMNDFGKTWKSIKDEFALAIDTIINQGLGVMFISHATEGEFQEQNGSKYNKIVPTMPKQARDYVSGFVDVIAYYGYQGTQRVLTVRGSDSVDAGHRIQNRFITPEGERIFCIPMGQDPAEGYENIKVAFDNKQEETYEPQRDFALSDRPSVAKKPVRK